VDYPTHSATSSLAVCLRVPEGLVGAKSQHEVSQKRIGNSNSVEMRFQVPTVTSGRWQKAKGVLKPSRSHVNSTFVVMENERYRVH
jgi:hypothetical protein